MRFRTLLILFCFCLPFMGFITGCFAGDWLWRTLTPENSEWEHLPPPPSPIAKFTHLDIWDVAVLAIDGQEYVCADKMPAGDCWIPTARFDGEWLEGGELYEGSLFPYPEQVAQKQGISFGGAWKPMSATYVLLKDGTLQRETYGVIPYYFGQYILAMLLGAFAGLVACSVASALLLWRNAEDVRLLEKKSHVAQNF